MNCPICGYVATRVNDTYWCPNDRIYIGKTLVTDSPPGQKVSEPIDNASSTFARFFDKFLWFLMGALYLVVIIFVVWGFTNGTFDTSPIFTN